MSLFDQSKITNESNDALDLLNKLKINCPFLLNHFYYDDEGRKVSLKDRYTSLRNFILLGKINESNIKEIIGQIFLAINELHKRNLVHRDIKLDNFLVFESQDKINIKLCDFDFIANHTDSLLPAGSIFPPGYLYNIFRYYMTDKKALDCYALGKTLKRLPFSDDKIEDLITKLTDLDPSKRWDIKKSKNHFYFGTNKKTRKKFFEDIKMKFTNEDIYIDHYLLKRIPDRNDPFYLMEEKIKYLRSLMDNLCNQLSFHEKFPEDAEAIICIRKTTSKSIIWGTLTLAVPHWAKPSTSLCDRGEAIRIILFFLLKHPCSL